jgi:hypothetical protein
MDLFVLHVQQTKRPVSFLDVKLCQGEEMIDLAWNPDPNSASVCATRHADGSVKLLEVRNADIHVLASLPSTVRATCCMYWLLFAFTVLFLMHV